MACATASYLEFLCDGKEDFHFTHGKMAVIQKINGLKSSELFICRDKKGIAIVDVKKEKLKHVLDSPIHTT